MMRGILCLAVLLAGAAAQAATLPVYQDAVQNGFQDYSYGGGSDFANAVPVHAGVASIAFSGANFNAVSLAQPTLDYLTTDWPVLRLWLHGGSAGGQQLRLYLQHDGAIVASAELDGYLAGGAAIAGAWQEVVIDLGAPPLAYHGAFDRIDLQSDAAGSQPTLYLDDIALQTAAVDPIFADGFDGDHAPAGPPPLSELHDVPIDGLAGDRFIWPDAAGQPREAVLAHNDGGTGSGGTHGGELREFRFQTGAGTRIVRAPASYAGGFGYVVSHRGDASSGIAAGDSPLGHGFGGQFQRLFEGRSHALFRFTLLYPRYSSTTANPPNTLYQVPVTIQWQFSAGQDNPLWSVTWDLSGVPANALADDSRAPYGEMLFDGSASAAAHSAIAGVAWGDRYRFTSLDEPLTYNSDWDWSSPNTIPWVKLWTTGVDATMGVVASQPISRQDAGGYWGVDRWSSSSASGGDGCGPPYGPATRMPCAFNWPYQSVNYSLNPATPGTPTNNTRLAWGTSFGFLGQTSYAVHGSAVYGGPLPTSYRAGWPRQSYSTYIVLGLHSVDAVAAQVAQVEAMQTVSLSASTGSVATAGSAGAGRSDSMSYQPAGYDPLHGALVFVAAGNALDAGIDVGSGTLHHPLVIVRNYSGSYPAQVLLDGALLAAGSNCYLSLRPATNELWITLNRDLAGSGHQLQVLP